MSFARSRRREQPCSPFPNSRPSKSQKTRIIINLILLHSVSRVSQISLSLIFPCSLIGSAAQEGDSQPQHHSWVPAAHYLLSSAMVSYHPHDHQRRHSPHYLCDPNSPPDWYTPAAAQNNSPGNVFAGVIHRDAPDSRVLSFPFSSCAGGLCPRPHRHLRGWVHVRAVRARSPLGNGRDQDSAVGRGGNSRFWCARGLRM